MDAAIPLQQPAVAQQSTVLVRRHSKLGVASLLIALGLPLLFLVVFAIMILLQGQIQNAAFTNFVVMLGASFVGTIGHLVGLVVGVVGALRKENKKLLSVLGIIFNSVPMLFAAIVSIVFVAFLIHPFPLGPK